MSNPRSRQAYDSFVWCSCLEELIAAVSIETKPFDAASWPAAGASADQTAPDVYQVDYALESAVRTADWPASSSDKSAVLNGTCSGYSNCSALAADALASALVGILSTHSQSNAPHSQYAESQIQNELL